MAWARARGEVAMSRSDTAAAADSGWSSGTGLTGGPHPSVAGRGSGRTGEWVRVAPRASARLAGLSPGWFS